MFKYIVNIIMIGLLLILSGCHYEQLVSWSPDGRYILFTWPENEGLWRCDSKTGETKEIKLRRRTSSGWFSSESEPLNKKLRGCQYFASSSTALINTEDQELFVLDVKSGLCDLLDTDGGFGHHVSKDGKRIYYVKNTTVREKQEYVLLEYKNGEKTPIFSSKDEFGFPSISPDSQHILYSAEHSINLYDIKEKKSVVLLSKQEGNFYYPKWANKNEIIYTFVEDKEDGIEDFGTLCKLSVDLVNKKPASESRILKDGVYPLVSISLTDYTHETQNTEEGKFSKVTEPVVIATVTKPDRKEIKGAIISVNTGNVLWESDVPFSAFGATLSPDSKKVAYLTGIDNYVYLEIQDLKSGRRTISWRNEAEKLFATAQNLTQAGEFQQALDTYRKLIHQFPDSDINDETYFPMAMLHLESPLYDLDAAYALIENGNYFVELPPKLRESLWRPEDRIAVDPAEDWIQTYATEESKKEFEYNTDLTRDLRGLWMREGKDWLYIRIDYETNRDLHGLAFQDTLLLFDDETPDSGSRIISNLTQWDKTADRKVLIRHWYNSGDNSQYDLEVFDARDEVMYKYLASGFAPSNNPILKYYGRIQEETNSIIYAISRKKLKLNSGNKVQIQVCTFKGGIESHKKLETPRFDPTKNMCDVADTFGEENTLERIKADKKERPDESVIIKGYAATLNLTM